MPDLISLLIGVLIGGAFVACLIWRAGTRLAAIATAAIRERDELRAAIVPLFAEVGEYRREEAQRFEYIKQEWI